MCSCCDCIVVFRATHTLVLLPFRWKLPSYQSAEDQETQATLTTTKRRMSVCPTQKSVQRSFPNSSKGRQAFHKVSHVLGFLQSVEGGAETWRIQNNCLVPSFHKVEWGPSCHDPPRVQLALNVYTGTLCRHPSCCDTKILGRPRFLSFVSCFVFKTFVALNNPSLHFKPSDYLQRKTKTNEMPILQWHKELLSILGGITHFRDF